AACESHDRYAAHGVTDQHDRTSWHQRVKDAVQILAELVDSRPFRIALLGTAVAALIVEDHPDGVAELLPQSLPLEVERIHVQRVAVHEHDGERRVGWAHLLVVQARAVAGDHHALPVVGLRREGRLRYATASVTGGSGAPFDDHGSGCGSCGSAAE